MSTIKLQGGNHVAIELIGSKMTPNGNFVRPGRRSWVYQFLWLGGSF